MRYDQRFSFTYDYPVYFTTGALSSSSSVLIEAICRREPERKHRICVLIEERVAELWPDLVANVRAFAEIHSSRVSLAGIKVIQGGEDCKNDDAPNALLAWFSDLGLDRQSVVLAIGGGAMQDLVGFAAAVTHRGLRMIRMPTTVLGQNDSGVGVKNGVNAFGKKNALGTFATPFAVINDLDFLRTLSPRDRIAGMAEAVKVALIKDKAFFDWLWNHADDLRRFESAAVATLVQRCAELHLQHIATSGDPFEFGSARPLDYGHWAAHKLESLSHYTLRHGEAVAIGLALDTHYSTQMNLLPLPDAERIVTLLERLGFTLWSDLLDLRSTGGDRTILAGIEEFREHLGGQLCVTMLTQIGRGTEVHTLSSEHINSSIDWLKLRHTALMRASPGSDSAMKLESAGSAHLTYCTNVHPGENLAEVELALKTHVASVRQQLGVPIFGVGLRLSAQAAAELDDTQALARFQELLNETGLYVFTLNGFPYGAFHRARIKERVYEPDWKTQERLTYTNRLARILAKLLPPHTHGSISTVPLGFRTNISAKDEPLIVHNLLLHIAELHRLHEETGQIIELGLEPEPRCYLETLRETAEFLRCGPFSKTAVAEFSKLTGLHPTRAGETLRRHLGVCLDACHMAVEFEDPVAVVAQLNAHAIRITKLQVSAGLRCTLLGDPQRDAPVLQALTQLSDTVYLHQVVEQCEGSLKHYLDLPDALAAYHNENSGSQSRSAERQWRIHFHVPVFMEKLSQLTSTRSDLQKLLSLQKSTPFCSHLEVETYTWDVLPEGARQTSLTAAIVQELNWTLRELGVPERSNPTAQLTS